MLSPLHRQCHSTTHARAEPAILRRWAWQVNEGGENGHLRSIFMSIILTAQTSALAPDE
jgi:hypothetical protein